MNADTYNVQLKAHNKADVANVVQRLEKMKALRHDYIVPAKDFDMINDGTDGARAVIAMGQPLGNLAFGVSRFAHQQVADKLDIPWVYYERMLKLDPQLLTFNTGAWLDRDGRSFLVRTLGDGEGGGYVRALLSDRYRVLDNHDLFFSAFETAKEVGAEIETAALSEDGGHFRMTFLHPEWRDAIRIPGSGKGAVALEDPVAFGASVTNSEVGRGALTFAPFIRFLICVNGAIGTKVVAQVHLGGGKELGYLSSEAIDADSRAIWLKIRDSIRATFNRDTFQTMVDELNGTAKAQLAEPVEAVNNVVEHFGFSEDDKQAILNELISPSYDRDPGRTVYGLIQAVTARAHAYEDEDDEKAMAFEKAGIDLLGQRELVEVRR